MNTYELLQHYDAREKQTINILAGDCEYLQKQIEHPDFVLQQPRIQASKRNQLRIQRNKMQEAAERRIAIRKALDEMKVAK